MSQQRREKAIILRRTNYGEADRVLKLLTPNGQISAMARGVRREKSKLAGGIELFAVSDVTLHEGKGDLAVLTSARLEVFYGKILEDYDRLQFGYEVTKQIARATDHVDEPEFFEVLQRAYAALNNLAVPLEVVQLWFWLNLAQLMGEGVNLLTDTNGMKLLADTPYRFDTELKTFAFDENGQFDDRHIKLLRILSGSSPELALHITQLDAVLPAVYSLVAVIAEG